MASAYQNPFRYGEIATGTHFTNRVRELRELADDIRNGQNVLIISPRRYGKTSLAVRVLEDVQREGVRAAYLDLLKSPSKARLAAQLATAIYNGMVAPFERAWRRAIGIFQRLPVQPQVTVNPADGSVTLEFTGRPSDSDLDRLLQGLLELPGRLAERQLGTRYAIILDEFQEVVTLDEQLPSLMRAVFQTQGEVAHVFLGSKRHTMQHLFLEQNQPLYRMTKPLALGPIRPEDFGAFIEARLLATDRRITAEGLQHLLHITEGHPYDTQELAYFVWTETPAGEAATEDTVGMALDRVLDAENARYTALWERLTRTQRLLLVSLLDDGREVHSAAYRQRHGLGAASTVSRAVKSLAGQELIDFVPPNRYVIAEAFLRHWLRRLTAPTVAQLPLFPEA